MLQNISLQQTQYNMKTTLLSTILLAFVLIGGKNVQAQPAPGGAVPPVITEIMYNPPEFGTDSLEFIELYNPSQTLPLNLGGFYFSSGIVDTIPTGVILPPDGRVVIAVDSVVFETLTGVPCLEWESGGLSNSGEGITLRAPNGVVADTVFYDDNSMWPSEADGDGYSLVLCDASADNNLPASWTSSENATGYFIDDSNNPGNPPIQIFADPFQAPTCTTTGIADDNVITTRVYPNPSNGEFRVEFDALENVAVMKIHNSVGQLVSAQSLTTGTTSVNVSQQLSSGYYILSIERENSTERVKVSVK